MLPLFNFCIKVFARINTFKLIIMYDFAIFGVISTIESAILRILLGRLENFFAAAKLEVLLPLIIMTTTMTMTSTGKSLIMIEK